MAPVLHEKEKMLDATTTKYDEIISSILRLAPEKWVEATKAAIDVEKDLDLEGGKQLFAQIVATVENEEEAKRHTASILRKDPELSPHTFPFIIFRQARLADLFLKNPEMHARLRTAAQNQAYNVGIKEHLELLDMIADDPKKVLEGFKIAMWNDEKQRLFGEHTLREICCAMAYYVDNQNAKICGIYPQYKAIPTWEEVEAAGKVKFAARNRAAKKLN